MLDPLILNINLFNSCQRIYLTISITDLLLCALRCGIAELLLRDPSCRLLCKHRLNKI